MELYIIINYVDVLAIIIGLTFDWLATLIHGQEKVVGFTSYIWTSDV